MSFFFFFFFNDTATTEIYTLSLHDALPILPARRQEGEELRRLVDRVGQPRRGADREGGGVKTATDGRTVGRSDQRAFTEPALWTLVGNTPLIPVRLSAGPTVRLKCEWLNPGG